MVFCALPYLLMIRTRHCLEQARYLKSSPRLLTLKKKDKRGSALGRFNVFLIIVPICNQDCGLPRRLDYDIHNSLAVILLAIQ